MIQYTPSSALRLCKLDNLQKKLGELKKIVDIEAQLNKKEQKIKEQCALLSMLFERHNTMIAQSSY